MRKGYKIFSIKYYFCDYLNNKKVFKASKKRIHKKFKILKDIDIKLIDFETYKTEQILLYIKSRN